MKYQKGQGNTATVLAVAVAVVIVVVIAATLIVSTSKKEVVVPVPEPVVTKQTVLVYFGEEGQNLDCSAVVGVEREIEPTVAVGGAALSELLKGPLPSEEADGLFTGIPKGTVVQSLSIENGVASVDFNSALDENVGGSCLVTLIRSQITETLNQFPTVNEVVISIDGETETILQP